MCASEEPWRMVCLSGGQRSDGRLYLLRRSGRVLSGNCWAWTGLLRYARLRMAHWPLPVASPRRRGRQVRAPHGNSGATSAIPWLPPQYFATSFVFAQQAQSAFELALAASPPISLMAICRHSSIIATNGAISEGSLCLVIVNRSPGLFIGTAGKTQMQQ